jgi:hypothetical protein
MRRGPRGEDQQEPRPLKGTHRVVLTRLEHQERPAVACRRFSAARELDAAARDLDDGALTHAMIAHLLVRR